MAAPDKIYVTIDRPDERIEYNPELVGVAWIKKDKSCEHIEYIRKDALMEWAKEHQEGERQGSYIWSCYQIFIDKLNSM